MNHFIVILSAILVAAHCGVIQVVVPMVADKLSLYREAMAECEAEYKPTTTYKVMLKKKLNKEPINEDEFKNSLYCIVTKIGVVDEHGHFVVDEVMTYFPSSVDKNPVRTILEDCNNKFSGNDPQDKFMSIFDCYLITSPTLSIPSD